MNIKETRVIEYVYDHKGNCPHCQFIEQTFMPVPGEEYTNREYWLMTEVFVYLHNGKDYCDYNKQSKP